MTFLYNKYLKVIVITKESQKVIIKNKNENFLTEGDALEKIVFSLPKSSCHVW